MQKNILNTKIMYFNSSQKVLCVLSFCSVLASDQPVANNQDSPATSPNPVATSQHKFATNLCPSSLDSRSFLCQSSQVMGLVPVLVPMGLVPVLVPNLWSNPVMYHFLQAMSLWCNLSSPYMLSRSCNSIHSGRFHT